MIVIPIPHSGFPNKSRTNSDVRLHMNIVLNVPRWNFQLTHPSRNKMAAISHTTFKCIFANEKFGI